MNFLNKTLFSFGFTIIMLIILGAGAAVATFIENDYGSETAKVLVYSAKWYEIVMILLGVSLSGIIYRFKMWRKPGAFLFHFGFIVILLGAGITRYIGYEGIMHIREGEVVNKMISAEPYLQIKDGSNSYQIPLKLGKIGNNHFKYEVEIENSPLTIEYKEFLTSENKMSKMGTLIVDATYKGETQEARLDGGYGMGGFGNLLSFKDRDITLSWGSKVIELPFYIKLTDFQLERYPGSMAPSSYASEVVLIDKEQNINMPFRIYMNHTLDHRSFKFFQSSYDRDEKGTILSVNNDPGKWPTYLGYFLLALGLIMNFFGKESRFLKLRNFLKSSNLSVAALFAAFLFNQPVKADVVEDLKAYQKSSFEHSISFGELLVQDHMGRIKPINTVSTDILNKIYRKSSLYGMTSEQVLLGMLTNPQVWQQVRMIKVSTPMVKKLFNLKESKSYISFAEAFKEDGYVLADILNEANRKNPAYRNQMEKDAIKIDERLNIAYMVFSGRLLRFIPKPNDPGNKWVDPKTALESDWIDQQTKTLIGAYLESVQRATKNGDWATAEKVLGFLKENQKVYGAAIIPSETKIKTEILFNELRIFPKLIPYYLIVGLLMLLYAIVSVFYKYEKPLITKIFVGLLSLGFIAHTIGLGIRWYIANHAPWSDTYESLVYIGWSAALAGVLFFRNSILALTATSVLAGIIMFVAHLSFIDPQITNLVPVLKSYWLTIHVSVITASYGFLGLGAMLGFLAMVLMIFRSEKRIHLDDHIREITAINEITLIIGLAMLTVGNFLGGVWANESWGRYWGWDPKETWAFISIVVYVVVTHLRFIPGLNSIYVFTFASTVAFSSILMTYFGVNFYLSGLHSYATGDPVPIPMFVYYLIAAVAAVSILAYRNRGVKKI